jgi:predicted deacetylase
MPSCRRLLASIHDVSPRFEGEVEQLLDLVRPHVGNRLALLVVPNHWRQSPIAPGSAFATRLRGWAEAGFEIFLHGMYHQDEARHDRQSDRLRAQWMTAGEGEFLGLPKREAADRIQSGQSLLEDITGQPIAGFIAPAWLYGPGAIEALAESGLSIAEDHMKVWSPKTGDTLSRSPVITWASRSRARRLASVGAASALRHLPVRDLRIGVHPGDASAPRLLRSIATTLRVAASARQPARYSDLLS